MGKITKRRKVKFRMTQIVAITLAALMIVGAVITTIVYLLT